MTDRTVQAAFVRHVALLFIRKHRSRAQRAAMVAALLRRRYRR